MEKKHIREKDLQQEKNRHFYLDVLRLIGMFAVVTIHVSALWWYDKYLGSTDWNIVNAYHSLFRYSIPLLLMISGAIFLNPLKKVTIKKIYTKNIFKMLSVFIFWSSIYALHSIYVQVYVQNKVLNLKTFKQSFEILIYGNYHMWFLYTIVGIYLIVPILREITKNKRILEYTILLGLAMYTINMFRTFPEIEKWISYPVDALNAHFIMGYTTIFLIGYYLHTYKIPLKYRKIIYILGIISLPILTMLTSYASLKNNVLIQTYYSKQLPLQVFGAAAIFLAIKNCEYLNTFKYKKTISYFSSLCLGVYLIHILVIEIFTNSGVSRMFRNHVIAIPILSIIVFSFSLLVSGLLRKIPLFKKHLL